MKIVPAGPTVKEMKREAGEYEQKARTEQEPHASTFREKAAGLRGMDRIAEDGNLDLLKKRIVFSENSAISAV